MKSSALFLFMALLICPIISAAQGTNGEAAEIKEFEYFKNVTPLREALKQLNMAEYLADEVAIYFVAFRINMHTKKIEEIRVTTN